MAVLQKVNMLGNERLDKVDFDNLQDFLADDYKAFNSSIFSSKSYIIKGFNVSDAGGLDVSAQVSNSAFLNSSNGGELFVGDPSALSISETLTDNAINYVHIKLGAETLAPDVRIFWDKTANSGQGAEFIQVVDTAEALNIRFFISTSGFSSDISHIPVAKVQTISGDIVAIHDHRNMFYRLGRGQLKNPDFDFPWISGRTEPPYQINLNSVVGTFLPNEIITGGTSTSTAKLTVGGTSFIKGNKLSGDFTIGETLTGSISGAAGILVSYFEEFEGADKSINGQKELMDAIMSEIRLLKGTDYWYEQGNFSFKTFFEDLALTIVSGGGTLSWTGTDLAWSSDITLKVIGTTTIYSITASTQPMTDGQVAYIDMDEGGNRGVTGTRTLNVVDISAVPISGNPINGNIYWIAYRTGNVLYVRGSKQELEPGEETTIGDTMSEDVFTYMGSTGETDNDPNYSSTNTVIQGSSLTTAIGALDVGLNTFSGDLSTHIADTTTHGTTGNIVGTTDLQTLSSKTLITPSIADFSANNNYIFGVNELVADRTITLPLLSGNDVFVFENHTQTLSNKTLAAPNISDHTNATHNHASILNGGLISHNSLLDNGTNTHTIIDSHLSNVSNPHNVSKANVGLSNVPNTDFTSSVNANSAHRVDVGSGIVTAVNPHGLIPSDIGAQASGTFLSPADNATITGTWTHTANISMGNGNTIDGVDLDVANQRIPVAWGFYKVATITAGPTVTWYTNGASANFRGITSFVLQAGYTSNGADYLITFSTPLGGNFSIVGSGETGSVSLNNTNVSFFGRGNSSIKLRITSDLGFESVGNLSVYVSFIVCDV